MSTTTSVTLRSSLEILFHRIPVEQIPVSIDDRSHRTDLPRSRKFYFVVGNIDLDAPNLGAGGVLFERQDDCRLKIADVAPIQRRYVVPLRSLAKTATLIFDTRFLLDALLVANLLSDLSRFILFAVVCAASIKDRSAARSPE
jgi:hypothetical protein